MNKIILIGRATKDCELRYSPNGLAIGTGSIAVNTGYGDKKRTEFFNFVAFGNNAENLVKFVTKGKQFCIDGTAGFNEYVNKENQKIKNFNVLIDTFYLLDSKKEASNASIDTFNPTNSKKEASFDDDLGF